MFKWFLGVWLGVLAMSAAQAEDRMVKLAASDYPPYYSANLEHQGYVTQLDVAAFGQRGYAVEIDFLPWSRALESTRTGKYDGLFTVWYREDRAEWFAFSDPLPANEIGFFQRRGEGMAYETLTDLGGQRVGIVRDYALPPGFEEAGLIAVPAASNIENMRKLVRGRIDLVISDKAVAMHVARTELEGGDSGIEWVPPAVNSEIQYLVVPKADPDHARTLADFNAGLAAITSDGTAARIISDAGF